MRTQPNQRDRQPRVTATLEEEPGDVNRIDHVGRLQLVEPTPYHASEPGQEIEPLGLKSDTRLMDTQDGVTDVDARVGCERRGSRSSCQ
jgi:hypothetical protein